LFADCPQSCGVAAKPAALLYLLTRELLGETTMLEKINAPEKIRAYKFKKQWKKTEAG